MKRKKKRKSKKRIKILKFRLNLHKFDEGLHIVKFKLFKTIQRTLIFYILLVYKVLFRFLFCGI